MFMLETLTYSYITTEKSCKESVEEITEYCKSIEKPILGLDTETYSKFGLPPKPIKRPDGSYEGNIALLQLGFNPRKLDRQFIFDVRYLGEDLISYYLKDILEKNILLGQNLKYDWGFLFTQLGIYATNLRDTMLISKVLNAGKKIQHDLGSLYSEFFGRDLYGWFIDNTGMNYKEYASYKESLQQSDWKQDLSSQQLKYAAEDVKLIFYLYERQQKALKEFITSHKNSGILDVIKLENNIIPSAALMELRGVEPDLERHEKEVIPFLEEAKKFHESEVAKYFSRKVVKTRGRGANKTTTEEVVPINLNSPQQVREALKPFCGELEHADKDTLLFYVDKHPAIRHILEYKGIEKLLTTYGTNYFEPILKDGKFNKDGILHEDGRFHPDWFQIGRDAEAVDTGRWACARPNLMNLPSRGKVKGIDKLDLIRGSIRARKGYSFIAVDVSNAEVRLMAQQTKDPILVDALNNDKDMHSITAKEVLELDYYPDDSDPNRKIGKQIYLSLQYMMGIQKFQNDMFIETGGEVCWTFETAKYRKEKFASTYRGITEAQNNLRIKIERIFEPHQTLADWAGQKEIYCGFTMMGRPRRWFLLDKHEKLSRDLDKARELHREHEVWNPYSNKYSTFGNEYNTRLHKIVREAFNQPIQGTVADILKIAQVNIERKLKELGFDPNLEGPVMQIHDELVCEIKDENIDVAKDIIYNYMFDAAKQFIKIVPVKITMHIGKTLAECKG